MMPIVDFTLEDVWSYLAIDKTPWGDAEDISALYKEATGECGLRKRKAGAGEKVDDPCGARFGCIICPLVTIDKSTRQISRTRPWYEPYADLRDIIIEMYKDPKNRAGYRRDGAIMFYGEGTFNLRARRELYDIFMQAQEDNKLLANLHGVEPQPILTEELINAIQQQWQEDERNIPYLAEAPEIGLLYETRPRGVRGNADQVIGQVTVNYEADELVDEWIELGKSTLRER
ncbi:hypothetical protein [Paenibacillus amylolyticus]|uniref:hypothetical protein n=1 Tax=Paenibacillus amylolyticus TaxID=1451 RepID=UPI000FD8C293|nr:hypothetical protein [Paenibacillus amylolyticus]